MKIKIAIPDNPVYSKLYKRKEEAAAKYDIEFYPVTEAKAASLMLGNSVDAALLTPLGYGLGVTKADYRIVPGPSLSTTGYTGLSSVFFKEGLKTINSVGSLSPEDFMMITGKILMAESYSLHLDITKGRGDIGELLSQADSAFVWGKSVASDKALDLSEEWHTLYDMPLPLGMWVCRAEEYPPEIEAIIKDLADPALPEEEEISERNENGEIIREGKITWHWSNFIEQALDHTLQLLYFHQLIPEIPAIKILGRE